MKVYSAFFLHLLVYSRGEEERRKQKEYKNLACFLHVCWCWTWTWTLAWDKDVLLCVHFMVALLQPFYNILDGPSRVNK